MIIDGVERSNHEIEEQIDDYLFNHYYDRAMEEWCAANGADYDEVCVFIRDSEG
jgi:hypothetical protein